MDIWNIIGLVLSTWSVNHIYKLEHVTNYTIDLIGNIISTLKRHNTIITFLQVMPIELVTDL